MDQKNQTEISGPVPIEQPDRSAVHVPSLASSYSFERAKRRECRRSLVVYKPPYRGRHRSDLGLIHRLQINCVAVMEEVQPDALAVSRDEILQEHPTLLSFIGPLCAEFFHEPTAFDSNDDGYWRTRELDFLLRALRTVRALAAIALDARVCLHVVYSSRLCSLLCINPSWGTSAGGPQ